MIRLQRSLLVGERGEAHLLEELCESLQAAIELEHSTIPLYLYSLYSLVPGRNDEIATIVRSAVIEEMLHMVLAANVLNALGGRPSIDRPDFVPAYPTGLPGGIEDQLRVHLAPFSMAQLDAFIEIEEPRDPIAGLAPSAPEEIGHCTIGEFYTSIVEALGRVAVGGFAGDPARQVGPELMGGSVVVTDEASAVRAIETIIEQGEGSSSSPTELEGPADADDYAHFYRFTQIQRGRRLVALGGGPGTYDYQGPEIVFDPSGVYAAPIDPRADLYPAGSAARVACDDFNAAYASLLGAVHALVNGAATTATFSNALRLMRELEQRARAMFSGSVAGHPVGPSFEYRVVPSPTT